MHGAPSDQDFILSLFDLDQFCSVLEARFCPDDPDALRCLLGLDADDDPELRCTYDLDDDELAAIVTRFKVAFDPTPVNCGAFKIHLERRHRLSDVPYLIHTNYELPLLLDGRKKLACISLAYPPAAFDGEDRFDRWVAAGVLHKYVDIETFPQPIKGYLGHRIVYYTPKGEEWRIPAMQLLVKASAKSGGWNEYFERLEGMLYGYQDDENDWWIDTGLDGGGLGCVSLCCAVTARGMDWIRAASHRALPPCEQPALQIARYGDHTQATLKKWLYDDQANQAIIRFSVARRYFTKIADIDKPGPWAFASPDIPDLNRHLRGIVTIAMKRDEPPAL